MSIRGTDIIAVAGELIKIDNEASYRSCISRAYYGMYHETLGNCTCVPVFSGSHHSGLIGYLTTPSEHKREPYDSRKLKSIGYFLRQQRDARNEADYHLADVTVQRLWQKAAWRQLNCF
ncbi:hypothetical protein [Enterobacter ludwigii]